MENGNIRSGAKYRTGVKTDASAAWWGNSTSLFRHAKLWWRRCSVRSCASLAIDVRNDACETIHQFPPSRWPVGSATSQRSTIGRASSNGSSRARHQRSPLGWLPVCRTDLADLATQWPWPLEEGRHVGRVGPHGRGFTRSARCEVTQYLLRGPSNVAQQAHRGSQAPELRSQRRP